MPFYIRKSIKIAPGLKLNVSKSGLGLSAGVKGARVSVGPRGTQINAGRDGIYYRKTLSPRAFAGAHSRRAPSVHGARGGHVLLRLLVQVLRWSLVLFVAASICMLATLSPTLAALDVLMALSCGLIASNIRRRAGGPPESAACLAAAALIGTLVIMQQMYYARSVAPRLRAARQRAAWIPTDNAVTVDPPQPAPWSYPQSYTMFCPYCAGIIAPTAVVCAHCCKQVKALPDGTWLDVR